MIGGQDPIVGCLVVECGLQRCLVNLLDR